MSEQRYGYTYHRVLIDSARVLDPQFPDAVLYVTGAQIELLRIMTRYLNRLSTYVSAYHPDYYDSPTIEDYDSILAIVADLENVLMGNGNTIWGYSERLSVDSEGTSIGGAFTDCDLGPVPAGKVYVVERWTFVHHDTQARACALTITGGDPGHIVYYSPNVTEEDYAYGAENLSLGEGDGLKLRVYALADTLTANLMVWGHIMNVPE